ncbi:VMAP-C domain-containing protein [Coleofasciculus sp.]|uniref:VMAP-C domain-containing protein n=1 Tax=Coleofasciculus sp. TaxID=3100458 RepID=UPI0039F88FE3
MTADDVWQHPVRVFGFPSGHNEGVWATGVLRGELGNGWIQMEAVNVPGYRVEPGFSGAPVWDETLSGVVGMAVAAERQREGVKAAFMIPTKVLSQTWSVLRESGGFVPTPTSHKPSKKLSRVTKLRIESLEDDLQKLEADYKQIDQKKRRESNLQEQNNLKRQLHAIANQIDYIEQEINQLKQGETGTQTQRLMAILASVDPPTTQRIKAAYLASRPSSWSDFRPAIPTTIEQLLADLADMPPADSGYKRIDLFVAHLSADAQISPHLQQQLQDWLKQNVDDVAQLLTQIQPETKPEQFYLMVWIQPSQQQKNCYFIKAWLAIPNPSSLSGSNYDYEPISLANAEAEPFPLTQIPQLLKEILIQSSQKCAISDLTFEFFLPRQLLNHEVDRWEIEISEDLLIPLGVECSVVVRSEERLSSNYCLKKKKWQRLKRLNHYPSSKLVASGDCAWNQLYVELRKDDILGCTLAKVPQPMGKESVFNVILGTAIPLAIWVRCNLAHLNCAKELNQLLECCISELPTMIQGKRAAAFSSHPHLRGLHIGSHLSLMWEDPERVPPTIHYSTP